MKRKILYDIFLSIISSFIPVLALQFIILPLLASKLDNETYGKLITITALMNMVAGTLGNVLNNSRLILNKKYETLNLKGDFQYLLLLFISINIIIIIFGLLYYDSPFNWTGFSLILFSSVLLLIKGYAVVEFRLDLNYTKILFESLFLIGGYFVGYVFFLLFDHWQLIYFFGGLSSFIFIYRNTRILFEPYKKTSIFSFTSIQTYSLLFSGILLSLGTYIDKLLLYPLFGGEIVAIYYTASLLGKTIALVIHPITGVFLSYLAPLQKFSNNKFILILGISTTIGIFSYIFVIIFSKPVLSILYPKYVTQALEFIPVVTLSLIILVISNIINAVLLKFHDLKWQIIINLIYIAIYVFMSLLLMKPYGLMGFCVGILISSIIKLLFMVAVYFNHNKKILA